MRLLLGMDDTDSPAAGCTTHAAWTLAQRLPDHGWRLWAAPRLVRLNPMAPHKTRGNAAVCLPVEGEGEPEALLALAAEVIGQEASHHPGTSPGIVVARKPPPEGVYWETVQRLVDPAVTRQRLEARGVLHAERGGGRGLTGALAACAWPAERGTWEHIAYRAPRHRDSPRPDLADVSARLDAEGGTFDSHDPQEDVCRVTPRGHDPVLWAIRGTDTERLARLPQEWPALVSREAPLGRWLLATNQATDDHLVADAAPEPFTARGLVVNVSGEPEVRRGGHAFVPARIAAGPAEGTDLTLAAFEPTKRLARAAALLAPGDRLVASGSFGPDAAHMNLEKFRVLSLSPRRERLGNPRCEGCGNAMRSDGRAQGYRCRRCGSRKAGGAVAWTEATPALETRTYEAAVCARRHLSMPAAFEAEPQRLRLRVVEPATLRLSESLRP